MLKRHFSGLSDLGNKRNVVSIVLLSDAFVWYFTVLSLLQRFVADILVWAPFHFAALIASALVGASFARRMERARFLILWMITGVVSSAILFGLNSESVAIVSLVSLFSGLALGFGMPACMSYFTDSVPIESRGRVSGVTMLASGIGMAAFGFVQTSELLLISAVLAIWRFSSLVVFLWAKDYRKIERKENASSFQQVFTQQSFILYFVPWIMFSLVNYLATTIASNNAEYLGETVQVVSMGISAVLGGFFIDSIGRKPIAIASFALLGSGAAILGFSSNSFPEIPYTILCFTSVIDGVVWGFLLVIFVLTLWGDLSHSSPSDKYYALGATPFFVSKFLELTVKQYIPESVTSSTALFSLTAFFLFLAVLPLIYAPETLPEKIRKERELKFYVEEAQEIAQKYY